MLTEKRPLIALVFWLRRTFPLPLLRQGQDCAKYSEDRGLKKRGRKISVGADYADFTDILLFYISNHSYLVYTRESCLSGDVSTSLRSAQHDRHTSYKLIFNIYLIPVGGINWGMKAYERGYLRARAEISADKGGDICGQKRRYLPAKPHKGLTDKVHIVVIQRVI